MEVDTYVGEHGQVVFAGREDEGGAGQQRAGWRKPTSGSAARWAPVDPSLMGEKFLI
jgi:hypothetical protein